MVDQENIRLTLTELPLRVEKLVPDEINNIFGGFGEPGSSCDNNCGCASNNCIIMEGQSIGYCA